MGEKLVKITKDTALPISLGLFVALVAGVWTLAFRVADWEKRLSNVENAIGGRWSFHMDRESWAEFQRINPEVKLNIPDVEKIRNLYLPIIK